MSATTAWRSRRSPKTVGIVRIALDAMKGMDVLPSSTSRRLELPDVIGSTEDPS